MNNSPDIHIFFKKNVLLCMSIYAANDRFNLIISSGADLYWMIARKQIFHEYILHILLIFLLSVAHSCLV